LFLKTKLLCIRSLQKLSSIDLIYSNVSFFLLRDGRLKLSPNCNRPITSLGIGMLQVLTNQFFLQQLQQLNTSFVEIGRFQLNHVRVSSWRVQKRIFRGVIDGRTEISDTLLTLLITFLSVLLLLLFKQRNLLESLFLSRI